MKNGKIKGNAKWLLAGHGFACALAVFAYICVWLAFGNSARAVNLIFTDTSVKNTLTSVDPLLYSGLRLLASCAALILSAFAIGAFRTGIDAWFWKRSTREYASYDLFFKGFLMFGKSAWLWISLKIINTAALIVFLIPAGIFGSVFYYLAVNDFSVYTVLAAALAALISALGGILFSWTYMQKFALSTYFISENPLMSAWGAIRESAVYMTGNERKLIMHKISFLPWLLSCVLILTAFYVLPYYYQSCACFARGLLMSTKLKNDSAFILGSPIPER